jgi:hypothetical protein
VVLVGDFFQLPPVVRRRTEAGMLDFADGEDGFDAEFAQASSAWWDLDPTVCYLSEQHRQDDQPFLELLDAIRANACSGSHRGRLAARLVEGDRLPAAQTGRLRKLPFPPTTRAFSVLRRDKRYVSKAGPGYARPPVRPAKALRTKR